MLTSFCNQKNSRCYGIRHRNEVKMTTKILRWLKRKVRRAVIGQEYDLNGWKQNKKTFQDLIRDLLLMRTKATRVRSFFPNPRAEISAVHRTYFRVGPQMTRLGFYLYFFRQFFLPPYSAAWFEPTSAELHRTSGTYGRTPYWLSSTEN